MLVCDQCKWPGRSSVQVPRPDLIACPFPVCATFTRKDYSSHICSIRFCSICSLIYFPLKRQTRLGVCVFLIHQLRRARIHSSAELWQETPPPKKNTTKTHLLFLVNAKPRRFYSALCVSGRRGFVLFVEKWVVQREGDSCTEMK